LLTASVGTNFLLMGFPVALTTTLLYWFTT
jgi:hypothetical protein